MQKEITLNGKPVAVSFTLTTLLTYEELTDSNFFGEQFEKLKERIALIYAAIYTADRNTAITVDDILSTDNWQEISDAFTTVMTMAGEFFKLPKVISDAEEREAVELHDDEKEDTPKN
jgi:hypothetical protein